MDKGILTIKEYEVNKISYGIYSGHEYIDISDLLQSSLMDRVEVILKVKNEIHKFKGELLFQNVNGLHQLFVGENNLDEILWNNVGSKIEFRLSVLKECDEILHNRETENDIVIESEVSVS